jgi:hypothetical protein
VPLKGLLVGLNRTQRLAKSLLSNTCHDRGVETRGKVLHWAEKTYYNKKSLEKEKKRKSTIIKIYY